jgi:hypothetical protein
VGLVRIRRDQELDLNSDAFLEVVRRHRVVFVQDWFFRNGDNCRRYRDVIRAFFTPFDDYLVRAEAAVEKARNRGSLVVGVHVRRGAYRTFKDGRYFYSHDQYRAVMERAEATFSGHDVSFFVCSDEPVPRGAFSGLNVVRGTGHQVEDLFGFSMCDRLLGPPSTYTKWASYYGEVPLYEVSDPDAPPEQVSFAVCDRLQ